MIDMLNFIGENVYKPLCPSTSFMSSEVLTDLMFQRFFMEIYEQVACRVESE